MADDEDDEIERVLLGKCKTCAIVIVAKAPKKMGKTRIYCSKKCERVFWNAARAERVKSDPEYRKKMNEMYARNNRKRYARIKAEAEKQMELKMADEIRHWIFR